MTEPVVRPAGPAVRPAGPAIRPAGPRRLRRALAPGAADSRDVVFLWDPSSALPGAGLEGLRVHQLTDGDDLQGALRTFRCGVVVIAAPPATERDIEAVTRVRRHRPGIRSLLVNASGAVDQRLAALAAGFDDAVPDELGALEIAGRIAVLARQARRDAPGSVRIADGIELDLDAHALRRFGRLVHLRPLEFRLLEELARHPGRPVSRVWLMQRVWGTRVGGRSRTVDVHIRWLREKVERDPDAPVHLLTVRGFGYQLETGLEHSPAELALTER